MAADQPFIGYRRRTRITPEPGRVTAEMADDFHHFRLELDHAGGRITGLRTTGVRVPWSLCPSAGVYLQERLIGRPLIEPDDAEDSLQHCTHQFDLAQLARMHAADLAPVQFDMEVSDAVEGRRVARLAQDGEERLVWNLLGSAIEGGPQDGRELRRLSRWIDELAPSLHEAARLLRRAATIASGRGVPLDTYPTAASIPALAGACYVFQPDRSPEARRQVGTIRDFSGRRDDLLTEEGGQ